MPTREEINQRLTQDPVFLELSPEEQRQVAREAYAKFGAGDPVKEAKQHLEYGLQPKPPRDEANAIDIFLKQAAIPTATSAAGTVLGGAVGGPVGATAGMALGSGLGEFINQQVGITPENPWSVGLSTILPPVLKAGAGAIQRIPKLLPGASAALQEQAAIDARALPGAAITVPRPSDPLFEQARATAGQSQTKMAMPKTMTTIQTLKDEETKALGGLQDAELIGRLEKMETGLSGGGLTFDEFDKTAKALGRKIGGMEDGELRGTYKALFKSLMEDAETMAPPAGVPLALWKDARQMYRKEMARSEFAQMIESQGIKKVGDFLDQVNPNAIANWMKSPKQEFWRKSLEPWEIGKIEQALKEWASIPTVPVRKGQPIGSGRRLAMIGVGGAAGSAIGEGGMGAALGALAADKGADMIAQALTSDTGRRTLMKILRYSGGKFGQEQAGLLGAFLAGGFGDDVPNLSQAAPSYQDGTNYVPETGPAKLHEGEMVIPKEQADVIRLLGQAKQQFPYLKDVDLIATPSPSSQAFGRQLEYWGPGSEGFTWQHGEAKRPAGIPLDKAGVEIFNPNLRPIDILADYVSHEAVKSDPILRHLYRDFASRTPESALQQRYDFHKKEFGEPRSFETWKEETGLPEIFRGYTFDQWDNAENYYTVDQLAVLKGVKRYLGLTPPTKANPLDRGRPKTNEELDLMFDPHNLRTDKWWRR